MTTATAAPCCTRIGVGFDTARYAHHVTFLHADLQTAGKPFHFPETAAGYHKLEQAFQQLAQRHPEAHFHIRIDAAGQYAANLEAFLRRLPYAKTISVGEPARNRKYREAVCPKRKADPVDSLAMARFALHEKPPATPEVPPALLALREIASRLEAQTRQCTRVTNQLHNLLARVFPELALLAKDIQAQWAVLLLEKYPTPEQVARAQLRSLTAIPHLDEPARPTAPATNKEAAGHSQGTSPAEKVVTAATVTVSAVAAAVKAPTPTSGSIDFAQLRRQVGMEQVLSHLGILERLRGSGSQRRGTCPIHAEPGDRRRTFSVNLKKNVFQCFDPNCNAHGNVLDFWAALRRLPLVEAAPQLAATFHLANAPDTEKRNP